MVNMRRLPKNWWVKPLLFALGAGILLWMIWSAGPSQLWQQLLQMGWLTLLGCVSVWGVAYVLNSCSWSVIVLALSGKVIHPGSMLRYTISGYALNYITPMGLLGGEPYRVWALKPSIGIEKATSSVMLYAMMHFCSHFLFWIIGCVVAWFVIAEVSAPICLLLGTVVTLCVLLLMLFFKGYRSGLVMKVLRLLRHLPWLGTRVQRWQTTHDAMLSQIDAGIASLLKEHRASFCWALGLELAARLFCCFEIVLIAHALGLHFGFAESLVVVAFSSLLANLLFFSPLQMGTREGGIAWALLLVGIAADVEALLPVAVAISMGTRIREFAWIAIGGLLSLRKR